jgi:hypothetical protein
MRLLFGIILGGILTVGGAYLYDSHNASAANDATASVQRPLVNWDVVDVKWHALNVRARSEWNRFTANSEAQRAVRPAAPRS